MEAAPSGADLPPSMPPLTIIFPRFTSYEPLIVFPSTSMLISFAMSLQKCGPVRFRSSADPAQSARKMKAKAAPKLF